VLLDQDRARVLVVREHEEPCGGCADDAGLRVPRVRCRGRVVGEHKRGRGRARRAEREHIAREEGDPIAGREAALAHERAVLAPEIARFPRGAGPSQARVLARDARVVHA
jgi:hypothetical protein